MDGDHEFRHEYEYVGILDIFLGGFFLKKNGDLNFDGMNVQACSVEDR